MNTLITKNVGWHCDERKWNYAPCSKSSFRPIPEGFKTCSEETWEIGSLKVRQHPSKKIIGTKSSELLGKRLVLCITGSVAAVRCPEIARELMRRGTDVYAVMTKNAQKIIHPFVMEWATGNPVVTELTGKIEHVELVGEHSEKADMVLIAPATANTISKIASGIDDTTVTTVASTAIGAQVPIIIVPAMHSSMYNHFMIKENTEKLQAQKVDFVQPRIEEEKAKIAETEEIITAVVNRLKKETNYSAT
jgi:phosphopantothenoylcysteine decarboxylase/phosphopantothenate--cysteine ligase